MLTAHSPPQLNLQCKTMSNAPVKMLRGSAITHGNTIYCMSFNSYIKYSFQADEDKWDRHSKCLHRNTVLTIINGHLTAVGGQSKREQTSNKVLSLKGGRWEEEVPPMVRARWRHAVVSDGHCGSNRRVNHLMKFLLAPPGPVWLYYQTISPTSPPHSVETWCMLWTGTAKLTLPPSLPSFPPEPWTQPHPTPAQHVITSTQLRSRPPPSPPSALGWLWWEEGEGSLRQRMSMGWLAASGLE